MLSLSVIRLWPVNSCSPFPYRHPPKWSILCISVGPFIELWRALRIPPFYSLFAPFWMSLTHTVCIVKKCWEMMVEIQFRTRAYIEEKVLCICLGSAEKRAHSTCSSMKKKYVVVQFWARVHRPRYVRDGPNEKKYVCDNLQNIRGISSSSNKYTQKTIWLCISHCPKRTFFVFFFFHRQKWPNIYI